MNRLIPLTVLVWILLAVVAFALWASILTGGSPTATAQVPSTATPAATSTAVPATSTPAPTQTAVIVVVTVFCEGPIQPFLAYAPAHLYAFGYPYNGVHGWAQPTLVTRVNGVVDFSRTFPNHPACTPAATPVPPRAPDIATPIIVRVVERVPAAPAAAPMVASQPARVTAIRPPSTGDAGLGE